MTASIVHRLLLATVAALPAIQGCTSFIPSTTLQTPILRKAGDIEASARVGNNGMDVMAAGAVSKHLMIGALLSWNDGNFLSQDISTSTSVNGNVRTTSLSAAARHLYGEGMIGYNLPFGGGSVISLIGGAGAGHSATESEDGTRQVGDYTRTFLQVVVGSAPEASHREEETFIFDGGVALRGSRMDFRGFRVSDADRDLGARYYLEPRVFATAWWGAFGIGMQAGMTVPLDSTEPSFTPGAVALTAAVRFSLGESTPLEP